MQVRHKVMSLQTRKGITRPRVTLCKITSSVIASVEVRAKKDGVKSLKFFNRKREYILLTPVDLRTGVGENKIDNDYINSYQLPSSEDESFTSKSDSEMDSDMDDNEEYESFVKETLEDGERINEELNQDDNYDNYETIPADQD